MLNTYMAAMTAVFYSCGLGDKLSIDELEAFKVTLCLLIALVSDKLEWLWLSGH